MFKIKRKTIRKSGVIKKKQYVHVTNNEPCFSNAEQRMPEIALIPTFSLSIERDANQMIDKLVVPNLPMLAKPENPNQITNINNYIYEEKYDGERMLTVVFKNNEKKCFTRTLRISNIFKHNILLNPGYYNCIFDGELVYTRIDGTILPICDTGCRNPLPTKYIIFDVQMINGENILHKPLLERKKLLEQCLIETNLVQISKYTKCSTLALTMDVFNQVCAKGGEGLMLKNINECYTPNRRQWIKLKKLHIIEERNEYDLYAYKFKLDKNGVRNILDCGYFDSNDTYVHVTNVSSGINNNLRNKLKLLSDENTGLFCSKLIVTIFADKVTNTKSLRHPVLHKIRNDIISVDYSMFL